LIVPNLDFEFMTNPPNFPMIGLRFLGLVSMIDPPKSTVPTAIETCRAGGVRVVMVTGDHPITARAIARQVSDFCTKACINKF